MKILAVDTSTNIASCAIVEDEKLLAELTINDKVTHSQKLLPLIADTLEACKLKAKDIDVFAVSHGPGSFTGLRIGVVTINSLAQAVDKLVVGVSSLKALAQNASLSEKLIVSLIDARKERVFAGLYSSKDGELKRERQADVLELRDLLAELEDKEGDILFIGEGAEVYKELILEVLNDRAFFVPPSLNSPRASSVAELAKIEAMNGQTKSYFELVPDYLRESQAQREYDERQARQC